jgi:cob(I)alamin adenosyltransferase
MSIVTKTGDKGTTGLMYGRRVMKCHPRIEACGAVDELNAALGLARAGAGDESVRDQVIAVQKDLVVLMGELAVPTEDLQRYVKDGYSLVTPEMTAWLETEIGAIEAGTTLISGWAAPGANLEAAALDAARTVCRRAERRVCALQQEGELRNGEVIIYLNRLADLLWLMARRAEAASQR